MSDGLREAIGQQVLNTYLWSKRQPNSGELALEVADALLAGPLAPLLAKLAAVEALANEFDYISRSALRRVLGGER